MNMENLIQVRAKELLDLVRSGPDNSPLPVIGTLASLNNPLQGDPPTTPSTQTQETSLPDAAPINHSLPPASKKDDHWNVQPQRRYFVEGRIIHKRKMSRKLFFLDITLMKRQTTQSPLCESWYGLDTVSDVGEAHPQDETTTTKESKVTTDSTNTDESCTSLTETKMEVIARYPAHSLKDLDELWHRVQLGAVVRVYGDIELSEPKRKTKQSTVVDVSANDESEAKWSALLHCLDFELLEAWQGKESFEPNPGTAKISSSTIQQSLQQKGSQKKSKGNRSLEEEIEGKDSSFPNKKPRHEKAADGVSLEGSSTTVMMPSGNEAAIRGDASQPHCKFWINSGKCNKTECLFWHETDPAKLKTERRRWVEARIQAKRQISHHASDPHQQTTKNQHRERALYFAQWLLQTFSRDFLNSGTGVLDIAGGRGDLSWELQTRQGIRSTIVEPRPGKEMRKWQRRWLEKFKVQNHALVSQKGLDTLSEPITSSKETETTVTTTNSTDLTNKNLTRHEDDLELDDSKTPEGLDGFIPSQWTYPLQTTEPTRIQAMMDDQFLETHSELIGSASMLIGLHPDQATEPIVRAALKSQKPFAVIPCCVFGRENPHRRLPMIPSAEKTEEETQSLSETVHDGVNEKDQEDKEANSRAVTSYDDFVTWLMTLHPGIETTWLNFQGMNRVVFWRGPPLTTGSMIEPSI